MKLKISLFLALFLAFGELSYAQNLDFDKVVLPLESRPKTFEDYLVQLAWNNSPKNQKLYTQQEIAKKEIKLAKKVWTQDITASFNLNEVSLSNVVFGDQLDLPVFYPIYNVGASINLGTFIYRPIKVKIAEDKEKMTIFDINQQKLLIRRDVLEIYETYQKALAILNVRVLAEQDAYGSYLLISEKFKNNDAKFEDFNSASSAYYSSKEGTVQAKSEVKVSKIRVEELIGITFEEAQRRGPKDK